MDEKAIINLIEETLKEKNKTNTNYIRYTFYELRVKNNLSEKDTDKFLSLIRNKLQNENYKVYFTGTKFNYNNYIITVQDNELMIAIKE